MVFRESGKPPVANATADELKRYNAYYIGDTPSKLFTLHLMQVMKMDIPYYFRCLKNEVPASFFLVGNYMNTSPELVMRMVEEGHIVANHTYSHPDMSKISTVESFKKEIEDLEKAYEDITGRR